jgi:hypothetical protein
MRPTNTSTQDPIVNLFETGICGVPHQEKRGQSELVRSESLPTECSGKEALEAAGVRFGEPYSDDPLFCSAELPAGWKKVSTSHSMYSDLLDEKGRKRAEIFYKAAFYDRKADMRATHRFMVSAYEDGADKEHLRVVVKDCGKVIHEAGEYRKGDYKANEQLSAAADSWLKERYADWQNVAAYWD